MFNWKKKSWKHTIYKNRTLIQNMIKLYLDATKITQ